MIDFIGSETKVIDHLAPVFRALPEGRRGTFWAPAELRAHGVKRGVPLTVGDPTEARPTIVASMADIKRFRNARSGAPLAYLEHGAGQSYSSTHPSYAGGKDRDDVSLFLVPNQHSADRWRNAYPAAEVAVVGSPKLGYLPQRDHSLGPTVCISFHTDIPPMVGWPGEMRNAFAHYRSVLPELAQQKGFNVIGHGHPSYQNYLRRYYRRAGIPMVEDFEDVCRRADLYICDNSSTIFEFAATGRPVLLLNAPWYDRHVAHGLRFWSESDVGLQVDEASELLARIETGLEDPPAVRLAREAAVRRVYPTASLPPHMDDTVSAALVLEQWAALVAA